MTTAGGPTSTDSDDKSDVVSVGGDGTYSANLTNLANGTITYLMTVSDPAGKTRHQCGPDRSLRAMAQPMHRLERRSFRICSSGYAILAHVDGSGRGLCCGGSIWYRVTDWEVAQRPRDIGEHDYACL